MEIRSVAIDKPDDTNFIIGQTHSMKSAEDLYQALAGAFVATIRNAFPINVLNDIKGVPEVCTVFCATANEVEVLVAETSRGGDRGGGRPDAKRCGE